VTETVPEEVTVKSCKLSSCGQFLVYGCCDGSVKMFDIKNKSTFVIMKLSGPVHYLQFCHTNDLTVVAADEKNNLKVSLLLHLLQ
jgi:WD40 repeat protein